MDLDKSIHNAWLLRAEEEDASSITRWFILTTESTNAGITVLQRVLGWDDSDPPKWCADVGTSKLKTSRRCLSDPVRVSTVVKDLLGASQFEARRTEPPVWGFPETDPCSASWDLALPIVVYELWALPDEKYRAAAEIWDSVDENELEKHGLKRSTRGYAGSAVVIIPQFKELFFCDSNQLVVHDGAELDQALLISEVRDGSVSLSKASCKVQDCGAWHSVPETEALKFLQLKYVEPMFSCMSAASETRPPRAARTPREHHGVSGSDWTLTVVDSKGKWDSIPVRLVRGFGGGYVTNEPWKSRAPWLGFSAPATVRHIPPFGEDIPLADVLELRQTGGDLSICDPYLKPAQADEVKHFLRRNGRVLLNKNKLKPEEVGDMTRIAANASFEIRTHQNIHDRFVIGRHMAFLLGTSLNSLGKNHSFITRLDNTMRNKVEKVFQDMWKEARPLGQ